MQVLCIENAQNPHNLDVVKKGEIYTSEILRPVGMKWRNIDSWHKLKELPKTDIAHETLFIPLSNIEGETYAKRKDVLVEI